jgi:poly [ADP-ribose] polymerase
MLIDNCLILAEKSSAKSMKRFVLKGKAPIDPECTEKINDAHVYSDASGIFDVMLNQVVEWCDVFV